MARLHVAVTGLCATGSGAVMDLLREYDNFELALTDQPYEHIPFYVPDGLFDLEYKLLQNNDPHRSDEAIRSFQAKMKWLNDNNFGWFGSYRAYRGDAFEQSVERFLGKIAQKSDEGYWYNRYKGVGFSPVKVLLQLGVKLVYHRPVAKWGRQYHIDKSEMWRAYPTADEFYEAARGFTSDYMEMCARSDKNQIFDHLLWPHNAEKIPHYFGDDFRLIVLTRDPRDLFILNKYYWSQPPAFEPQPFPLDADKFCEYWGQLNRFPRLDNGQVLYVQFENLIYRYDEEVARIERFLGVDAQHHTRKKECLDPARSIKNTQSFRIKPEWEEESRIIGEKLPELIYDFPYRNETALSEMFV